MYVDPKNKRERSVNCDENFCYPPYKPCLSCHQTYVLLSRRNIPQMFLATCHELILEILVEPQLYTDFIFECRVIV